MCRWTDSDGGEVYRAVVRTAIKPHVCEECGRAIEPGERYRYSTGLFDGSWWDAKMCLHCEQVTRWLEVACKGWLHHVVIEDLWEHITGDEWFERNSRVVRIGRWQRARWRTPEGNLRPIEDLKAVVDQAITLTQESKAA